MIYTAFADHDKHRNIGPALEAGVTGSQRKVNDAEQLVSGSLCRSCVKRATCSLPGRASGVWHCEEYF